MTSIIISTCWRTGRAAASATAPARSWINASSRYDTSNHVSQRAQRRALILRGDATIRAQLSIVPALLLAGLLVACGAAPENGDEAARATRPVERQARSVVLITVDTTRPDRLQPYGADNVATPAMMRLAQRGIVFERAWATAPITLVAHTSILSGLYPFEHGVRNNGIQYVAGSVTTLAERLRDAGYRTAAFVSAAVLEKRYGLDQGFEIYDDDLSERRNLSPRMVADRPAEATVEAASAWLDALAPGERFFTWVHFYDPHASYSPPPPYRDEYRDRLYDGEIAYMDAQIGRLLQHPRLLGPNLGAEGEETPIVMLIGDHGESLGEHGERTHAILAYNSTLHVPFIAHLPGGPQGLRIPDPVGQVDVMPTLLSLLGLDPPRDSVSGRDLVPLIEGRSRDVLHPYYSETWLPFYTYGWAKLSVLHRGRFKLIDAPTPELYDLQRDPRELTDLHAVETGTAHDMERDLGEWLAQHEADREAELPLDGEALAKLRALGYLSVGSGRAQTDGERPNPMAMIDLHVGLERARMFLADQLYDQAVRQLETVLRRDPQNLAALIDLVRAHEGLGEIERALELAERALELDPDYTQTYLHLARLETRREDFERALELTELAAQNDPKNPEVKIQQATILNRLGRHEEIERVLGESLAANPEHPRTHAVYAQMVEARRGDLAAAEERLRGALERDPFLEQGWLFLGAILERDGRLEEAEASYGKGLVARPDDPQLHGALGHLLARQGRLEEAVGQLREAIRLSPEPRSELHVSLGGALAEMGRNDEAQREYDKALALDSDHPGARNNAAIALYRSGRAAEAVAMLRALIEEFPRHADAHNNLAAIAVEQERWDDVIEHAERTLELAPQLVEAWNNLGIGREEKGDLEGARQAYEKALEIDAEYWPAWFNLGACQKKNGAAKRAREAFEEVLARVPNHVETHLELGELYAGPLADGRRARIHWNAFLRYAPGHPRQEEIRRRLTEL